MTEFAFDLVARIDKKQINSLFKNLNAEIDTSIKIDKKDALKEIESLEKQVGNLNITDSGFKKSSIGILSNILALYDSIGSSAEEMYASVAATGDTSKLEPMLSMLSRINSVIGQFGGKYEEYAKAMDSISGAGGKTVVPDDNMSNILKSRREQLESALKEFYKTENAEEALVKYFSSKNGKISKAERSSISNIYAGINAGDSTSDAAYIKKIIESFSSKTGGAKTALVDITSQWEGNFAQAIQRFGSEINDIDVTGFNNVKSVLDILTSGLIGTAKNVKDVQSAFGSSGESINSDLSSVVLKLDEVAGKVEIVADKLDGVAGAMKEIASSSAFAALGVQLANNADEAERLLGNLNGLNGSTGTGDKSKDKKKPVYTEAQKKRVADNVKQGMLERIEGGSGQSEHVKSKKPVKYSLDDFMSLMRATDSKGEYSSKKTIDNLIGFIKSAKEVSYGGSHVSSHLNDVKLLLGGVFRQIHEQYPELSLEDAVIEATGGMVKNRKAWKDFVELNPWIGDVKDSTTKIVSYSLDRNDGIMRGRKFKSSKERREAIESILKERFGTEDSAEALLRLATTKNGKISDKRRESIAALFSGKDPSHSAYIKEVESILSQKDSILGQSKEDRDLKSALRSIVLDDKPRAMRHANASKWGAKPTPRTNMANFNEGLPSGASYKTRGDIGIEKLVATMVRGKYGDQNLVNVLQLLHRYVDGSKISADHLSWLFDGVESGKPIVFDENTLKKLSIESKQEAAKRATEQNRKQDLSRIESKIKNTAVGEASKDIKEAQDYITALTESEGLSSFWESYREWYDKDSGMAISDEDVKKAVSEKIGKKISKVTAKDIEDSGYQKFGNRINELFRIAESGGTAKERYGAIQELSRHFNANMTDALTVDREDLDTRLRFAKNERMQVIDKKLAKIGRKKENYSQTMLDLEDMLKRIDESKTMTKEQKEVSRGKIQSAMNRITANSAKTDRDEEARIKEREELEEELYHKKEIAKLKSQIDKRIPGFKTGDEAKLIQSQIDELEKDAKRNTELFARHRIASALHESQSNKAFNLSQWESRDISADISSEDSRLFDALNQHLIEVKNVYAKAIDDIILQTKTAIDIALGGGDPSDALSQPFKYAGTDFVDTKYYDAIKEPRAAVQNLTSQIDSSAVTRAREAVRSFNIGDDISKVFEGYEYATEAMSAYHEALTSDDPQRVIEAAQEFRNHVGNVNNSAGANNTDNYSELVLNKRLFEIEEADTEKSIKNLSEDLDQAKKEEAYVKGEIDRIDSELKAKNSELQATDKSLETMRKNRDKIIAGMSLGEGDYTEEDLSETESLIAEEEAKKRVLLSEITSLSKQRDDVSEVYSSIQENISAIYRNLQIQNTNLENIRAELANVLAEQEIIQNVKGLTSGHADRLPEIDSKLADVGKRKSAITSDIDRTETAISNLPIQRAEISNFGEFNAIKKSIQDFYGGSLEDAIQAHFKGTQYGKRAKGDGHKRLQDILSRMQSGDESAYAEFVEIARSVTKKGKVDLTGIDDDYIKEFQRRELAHLDTSERVLRENLEKRNRELEAANIEEGLLITERNETAQRAMSSFVEESSFLRELDAEGEAKAFAELQKKKSEEEAKMSQIEAEHEKRVLDFEESQTKKSRAQERQGQENAGASGEQPPSTSPTTPSETETNADENDKAAASMDGASDSAQGLAASTNALADSMNAAADAVARTDAAHDGRGYGRHSVGYDLSDPSGTWSPIRNNFNNELPSEISRDAQEVFDYIVKNGRGFGVRLDGSPELAATEDNIMGLFGRAVNLEKQIATWREDPDLNAGKIAEAQAQIFERINEFRTLYDKYVVEMQQKKDGIQKEIDEINAELDKTKHLEGQEALDPIKRDKLKAKLRGKGQHRQIRRELEDDRAIQWRNELKSKLSQKMQESVDLDILKEKMDTFLHRTILSARDEIAIRDAGFQDKLNAEMAKQEIKDLKQAYKDLTDARMRAIGFDDTTEGGRERLEQVRLAEERYYRLLESSGAQRTDDGVGIQQDEENWISRAKWTDDQLGEYFEYHQAQDARLRLKNADFLDKEEKERVEAINIALKDLITLEKQASKLRIEIEGLDEGSEEIEVARDRLAEFEDSITDAKDKLRMGKEDSLLSGEQQEIYDNEIGNISYQEDRAAAASRDKRRKEVAKQEVKDLKEAYKEVIRLKKELAGVDEESELGKKVKEQLSNAEANYKELDSKDRSGWTSDQEENFAKFKSKQDALLELKESKAADKKESDKVKAVNKALRELINTEKDASNLRLEIEGLDENSDKAKRLKAELAELEEYIGDVRAELNLDNPENSLLNSEQSRRYSEQVKRIEKAAENVRDKRKEDVQKIVIGYDDHTGSLSAEYSKINANYKKLMSPHADTTKAMTDYARDYQYLGEVVRAYSEASAEYDRIVQESGADSAEAIAYYEKLAKAQREVIEANEQLKASATAAKNAISIDSHKNKEIKENEKLIQQQQSLILKMEAWKQKSSKLFSSQSADAKALVDEYERLEAAIRDCTDVSELRDLNVSFGDLKNKVKAAGLEGESAINRLKNKFREYAQYAMASFGVMEVVQGLKMMAQEVLEVDTAMTGLLRVTEMTNSETEVMFDKMVDSAKNYGRTLTDTINATADWVRAGFDENTALRLAEVTAMYQNVSDLDYDEASENLLTSYRGFEKQLMSDYEGDTGAAVEHITDVLNELDNNFSVTSAGLGEGLARSASALQIAGNTFEESAA